MLLKELNLGHHRYEFSSLAVSLSLEGKASQRELTSRLLSDLSGKVLSERDMSRAFDKILKELPDLILDTPEAPQVRENCHLTIKNFIKRIILLKEFNQVHFLFHSFIYLFILYEHILYNTWFLSFLQMLGQFIARAIADHALPMSFLDCYKGKVDCDHAR